MTDFSDKLSGDKTTALVQLTGTVAHELNNIFTAVTGNLSLLDQEMLAHGEQNGTVRDLMRAVQRGIALTAKMQAFAGRQRLHRQHLDLNHLVATTLQVLRPSLSTVDLRLKLAEGKFVVYIDQDRMVEAIGELVKNARAALPQTGGRLTVETLAAEDARKRPCVLLRVRDNGRGMTPDILARATEPLFSTNPHGIHTGWGLSNTSGFVRQSGGLLTISSQAGSGTSVDILMPLDSPAG